MKKLFLTLGFLICLIPNVYGYDRTTWVDGQAPALNATNLNHIEAGIDANESILQGCAVDEVWMGGGVGSERICTTYNSISLNSAYSCDIAAAVIAIEATTTYTDLLVDCIATIADGVTVTTNYTALNFATNGYIKGTSGGGTETLAIGGGLIADLNQYIFGDDLSVTGGNVVKEVSPNYWTRNVTPGTTEMGTGFQAALDFLKSGNHKGGTIQLLNQEYKVTPDLIVYQYTTIRGAGQGFVNVGGVYYGGSQIVYYGTDYLFNLPGDTLAWDDSDTLPRNINFENFGFTIVSSGTGKGFIEANYWTNSYVKGVFGRALGSPSGTPPVIATTDSFNLTFDSCKFTASTSYNGISVDIPNDGASVFSGQMTFTGVEFTTFNTIFTSSNLAGNVIAKMSFFGCRFGAAAIGFDIQNTNIMGPIEFIGGQFESVDSVFSTHTNFNGAGGFKIRDNFINDCGVVGTTPIFTLKSHNTEITGNQFHNINYWAVKINGGISNVVAGNYIPLVNSVPSYGIWLTTGSNLNTIKDNSFWGFDSTDVECIQIDSGAEHNFIGRQYFRDVDPYGIVDNSGMSDYEGMVRVLSDEFDLSSGTTIRQWIYPVVETDLYIIEAKLINTGPAWPANASTAIFDIGNIVLSTGNLNTEEELSDFAPTNELAQYQAQDISLTSFSSVYFNSGEVITATTAGGATSGEARLMLTMVPWPVGRPFGD